MATIFASATRTQAVATYNSDAFTLTQQAHGLWYHLNVSAIGTTPTLDLKMQIWDDAVSTWEDYTDWEGNVVSFPQKTTVSEDTCVVYPSSASMVEATHPRATARYYAVAHPRRFRWVATVGDAGGDTITFSLASAPLA